MADIEWTGRRVSSGDDVFSTSHEVKVNGKRIAVIFSHEVVQDFGEGGAARDKAEEKIEAALDGGQLQSPIRVTTSDFR